MAEAQWTLLFAAPLTFSNLGVQIQQNSNVESALYALLCVRNDALLRAEPVHQPINNKLMKLSSTVQASPLTDGHNGFVDLLVSAPQQKVRCGGLARLSTQHPPRGTIRPRTDYPRRLRRVRESALVSCVVCVFMMLKSMLDAKRMATECCTMFRSEGALSERTY
jgi:hypothetical protein